MDVRQLEIDTIDCLLARKTWEGLEKSFEKCEIREVWYIILTFILVTGYESAQFIIYTDRLMTNEPYDF